MSGREPVQFLNDVFNWIEITGKWPNRDDWHWIVYGNGVVDMQIVTTYTGGFPFPSEEFIDTEESVEKYGKKSFGTGIGNLLSKLEGKKVISIDDNGNWYLKIVE